MIGATIGNNLHPPIFFNYFNHLYESKKTFAGYLRRQESQGRLRVLVPPHDHGRLQR